jgi:hypothetical protein
MNDRTTLAEAKAAYREQIATATRALHLLEAITTAPLPRGAMPAPRVPRPERRLSVARAAIEMLARAQRPLHGMTEIVPHLQAEGYNVHAHGLATTLLRTGLVERVSRGTFALKPGVRSEQASSTANDLTSTNGLTSKP